MTNGKCKWKIRMRATWLSGCSTEKDMGGFWIIDMNGQCIVVLISFGAELTEELNVKRLGK